MRRLARLPTGPTLDGIVRPLHRGVGRLVRHVEAEGLVLVLLDELQGVFVDQVRGVALLLRLLAPMPPVVLHVVAPVVDVVDVSAVVALEVIKAVVLRMVFRVLARIAQMPLSHYTGNVPGLLEQLGEGHLGLMQPLAMFRMIGVRMNNGLNPHPLLVTPREQSGPRGRTHRAAGMEVREEHSLPRQAVHARRLVMGVAVGRDAWPRKPHVIHHHDHDVGPGGFF